MKQNLLRKLVYQMHVIFYFSLILFKIDKGPVQNIYAHFLVISLLFKNKK